MMSPYAQYNHDTKYVFYYFGFGYQYEQGAVALRYCQSSWDRAVRQNFEWAPLENVILEWT